MLLGGNRCCVPWDGHAPRATEAPRYWKSETKNIQCIFGLNFSPSLFELGKFAILNSVNDGNTLLYRHVLAKWAVL